MSPSGKDNLENFFRKGIQNHNPEFNEADWLKMKARLDNEFPVRFAVWPLFRKYWYVPVLLIFIPVSWIAFSEFNTSNDDISNNSISTTQQIKASEEQLKSEENAETNRSSYDLKKSEKPIIIKEEKTISKTKSTFTASGNLKVHSTRNILTISDDNMVASNGDTENTNKIGYVVFENGAEFKGQILNYELHFLVPISPNHELDQGNIIVAPYVISKSEIRNNGKLKPYFSMGLGYSPDFSTVGLGNFSAPGSRLNVLAEFSFLNRWSINTGIVFVNNKYEAYGEDYHAPPRYWKGGVVASETYGECKMIDIPFNLRYDVISTHRHKLFISAGASTYFVIKEDYYFHYEQDDPDLPYHWGTDEMTPYPFGVINASMGYEYQLGKKSALQIEPFIKIPTTGIGWGKVDLHTIGIYFIYKHRVGK